MLTEAWKWLLAPAQEANPGGGVSEIFWEEKSVSTSSLNPLETIFRVLVDNEMIFPKWAPIHLKNALQTWFWREGKDEAEVMAFWKACCSYSYLPRLTDNAVLQETIMSGLTSTDFFAYAIGKEESRYLGLHFGKPGSVYIDQSSLLVRPTTAAVYLEAQAATTTGSTDGAGVIGGGGDSSWTPGDGTAGTGSGSTGGAGNGTGTGTGTGTDGSTSTTLFKRFHGTVKLNHLNVALDADKIANEIVQHFTTQVGTSVTVTLEIEAESPRGISDAVRRIVLENARSLRFTLAEFEEE